MHVPDRVYGMETEYGTFVEYPNGAKEEMPEGAAYNRYKVPDEAIVMATIPWRMWHGNGSCTYVDTGEHPEHATAECRTVKDLIRFARAGDRLMEEVFSRTLAHAGRLRLVKNNLACDAQGSVVASFGCHENYLAFHPDTRSQKFADDITPFLITRQIIDGAGWWHRDGTYRHSQRALIMGTQMSASTTNKRPIFNIKDTLNDTGPFTRIHLIAGDSNVLEPALFLKFGTTSLVLALLEAGHAPLLSAPTPHVIMEDISREGASLLPCDIRRRNEQISPWEVQTLFHEAVREHLAAATFESPETEAETSEIMRLWECALNAIYRNDRAWMIGRLDWATKQYLIENMLRRQPKDADEPSLASLRKDMDLSYHMLGETGPHPDFDRRWRDRRMVTEQEIVRAIHSPPERTRANPRGRFVATIARAGIIRAHDASWIHCGQYHPTSFLHLFHLPHPLRWNRDDFEVFLKQFNRPPAQ